MAVQDALEAGYKNPDATHGEVHTSMAPRRKRKRVAASRRTPPAKRRRRRQRRPSGQIGGVAPGLILGIGKAGYKITKALEEPLTKNAIKIAEKRRRDVASGKRKRYAGESFNCTIM